MSCIINRLNRNCQTILSLNWHHMDVSFANKLQWRKLESLSNQKSAGSKFYRSIWHATPKISLSDPRIIGFEFFCLRLFGFWKKNCFFFPQIFLKGSFLFNHKCKHVFRWGERDPWIVMCILAIKACKMLILKLIQKNKLHSIKQINYTFISIVNGCFCHL